MKKFFLVLIFCFYSAPVTSQEYFYDDGFCASLNYHPPIMNFTASFGKLTYDFTKSSQQLTSERKLKNDEYITAGRAVCPFYAKIKTELINEKVGRRKCLFVYSIDVFYGYKNPVIYVANDYEQDSCQFKKTLRHEKQHMAIYILGLEYFIPKLKEELTKEFLKIKPREYIDQKHLDEVAKEMRAEHKKIVKKYKDKYNKIMRDWHDLMDNKENYDRENLICIKVEKPTLHMYMTLDDETEDYIFRY